MTLTQSYSPEHPQLLLDLEVPTSGQAPAEGWPTIVWLHGGGWRLQDRLARPDFTRHFADRGFAMASIDYRLAPDNTHPAQSSTCARPCAGCARTPIASASIRSASDSGARRPEHTSPHSLRCRRAQPSCRERQCPKDTHRGRPMSHVSSTATVRPSSEICCRNGHIPTPPGTLRKRICWEGPPPRRRRRHRRKRRQRR